MKASVVLAPGLWMPAAAMALLSARLQRRGYEVHVFAYRGRSPYDANVDALAAFARGKTLFVGHSLGGVLILDMLMRHPEIPADAVVLLGAPVRGSLAGRRFGRARLGRWMMGDARALWEERAARWCAGAIACSSCRERSAAWSPASSLQGDSHEAASWNFAFRADRRMPVL